MGRSDRAEQSGSSELERLLLQMTGRDEAAFEKLYVATKRKLFSTVLSVVRQRHLAEEIVQEAYVRIWLNAGAYHSSRSSPMTWMIAIARNLAIDAARRPVREVYSDYSTLLEFPSESPTALEMMELRDKDNDTIKLQHTIFFALQALKPIPRQLVIAAYLGGESRHRLSERYGVPVNTIKTWIRRALLEVRVRSANGDLGFFR